MRKTLLLITSSFLFSFGIYAQENFRAEENSIVWQKVYQSELSKEEIRNLLKQDSELNPVAAEFSGISNPVKMYCERAQRSFMRDKLRFFTNIEFREGRYRVTVNKIELVEGTTVEPYEYYQLRSRDGEIRKNKIAQNSLHCLDQYFQEKFDFELTEEDW